MSRVVVAALCALLWAPPLLVGWTLSSTPAITASPMQRIRLDWIRKNLMLSHYRSVLETQEAVIRSDLAAVGPLATGVGSEVAPPRMPAKSASYLDAMREAAQRTAAASDLKQAAEGTATLLATCGECHAASGVRPELIAPPTSGVGGVVGHMLNHEQAVELMLEGLVIPSRKSWEDGARGLKDGRLPRHELPSDPQLSRTVVAAEDRVHTLGEMATRAANTTDRKFAYAQILTTCASCHAVRRDAWGPAR